MFANQECKVYFLDCRGYFDLAAQIIGIIFTIVVLYRAYKNYRELMQQKSRLDQGSQYQKSVERKAKVNMLNIIFLALYLVHILFSMILFQLFTEMTPDQFASYKFNQWYKSSEILFVQLINILFLGVGWLYWHGLHYFFQVNEVDPPLPFNNRSKNIFYLVGFYCLLVACIGTVLTFINSKDDTFTVNLLVLISSGISMTLLIFYRFSYYKNIFRSTRLTTKIIRRQRFYNLIIFVSSISRIMICLLQIIGIDYDEIRNYSNCIDISPFHAMVLLFITLIINLLPSFVFTRIFTTFERQKRMHTTDIQQTIFSNRQSEEQSTSSKFSYKK